MEFILEFLPELIIEGTVELGTSKKVALPIRILLLLLFLLIYGTLIGVIAMVGIEIWQGGNVPFSCAVIGIDIAVAILAICWIVKQYRKNHKDEC